MKFEQKFNINDEVFHLNHPRYKFFDTVKKVFPENQDDYSVDYVDNCSRRVYFPKIKVEGYRIDGQPIWNAVYCPNIIAVPFTGFEDINDNKGYDQDILEIFDNRKFMRGVIAKGEPILEWRVWFEKEDREMFLAEIKSSARMYQAKIIGSYLTNPELLEVK